MPYDSFPTREQILDYIAEWETTPSVKEIARAFHLKREDVPRLKEMLEGKDGGEKIKTKKLRLPPMLVLDITALTADGELLAIPAVKDFADAGIQFTITAIDKGADAAKIGDRVLAKIKTSGGDYLARITRILPPRDNVTMLGVLNRTPQGIFLEPVYRKERRTFSIDVNSLGEGKHGDLVEAEVQEGSARYGFSKGRILRVLGRLDNPHAASHIAIHRLGIPVDFPEEVFAELDDLEQPTLTPSPLRGRAREGVGLSTNPEPEERPTPIPAFPLKGGRSERTDLRSMPLITIDGEDARDFDDAVHAEADTSKGNPGGWKITVAIADVAHYVKPNSALDLEAQRRGNSVYFPDRVIPMLPEVLSNGLCSLKPNEDRYCLAAHITVDAKGNTLSSTFTRGLMRSVERRTYKNIQEEIDTGKPSSIVRNIYNAYLTLKTGIVERGPLELNLPEYKVCINEAGKVTAIEKVKRLDAHNIIEAYMVLANIAVADFLSDTKIGAIYRVHASPDPEKLRGLKEVLDAGGYRFALGNKVTAKQFNGILRKAEAEGAALAIHNAVLRTQMQAYYSPHNDGHFGLALTSYCHFTSPIRRYSDLVVHRALIRAKKWEKITEQPSDKLAAIAEHISTTERRAMKAERDAMDRYTAAFLTDRVGAVFEGHISGATDSGLFVTLDDTGAEGFVPKMSLQDDMYHFDKKGARLMGRRTGRIYSIGLPVKVILDEVMLATGSIRLKMAGESRRGKAPQQRPEKNPHKKRFKHKRR